MVDTVIRILARAGVLTVGAVVGYLTAVYIREARKARAEAARWAAVRGSARPVEARFTADVGDFLDRVRKAAEQASEARETP